MEKVRQTPSQTVGPFFAYGLTARQYGYDYTSIMDGSLVTDYAEGEPIKIIGRVYDGAAMTPGSYTGLATALARRVE